MKVIFFLCVISFNFLFSQELTKDEYLIYGEHLAGQQLNSGEFSLGIPDEYKNYMNIEHKTLDEKIRKISSVKSLDLSKLESIVTQLTKEKLSTFIYKDKSIAIFKEYCSPIYFKNKREAYFFSVGTVQFKDRDWVSADKGFYRAFKKDNGYWDVEVYIPMY
ncbi:hypothetical protein [Chryseobacterium taiwanense]|uniref:Uncharacterized protein n=1 Tax=Chryseobacterium taiwanense TaxID=363331 RepID=A0A0B4CNI1_9FLAO|nr:hypothetical protein [Chryseobacterium taiwanense]KIC62794.1 hypothetical protein RM51_11485 [Chryseobacterium taiwanense]